MLMGGADDDAPTFASGGITWEVVGTQLQHSLIMLGTLIFVCAAIGPWWRHQPTPNFILMYVGQEEKAPKSDAITTPLRVLQGTNSVLVMAFWFVKCYIYTHPLWMAILEILSSLIFLIDLIFTLVRSGFDLTTALSMDTLVDCLTIPSLLAWSGGSVWLTFTFLRASRVYESF